VGKPEEKRSFEKPRTRYEEKILKWILKEVRWNAWYGLVRLRRGTSGGLL